MHKLHEFSLSRSSRRRFFRTAAAATSLALTPRLAGATALMEDPSLPSPFSALKPLGSRVRPITPDEFRERIAHAQRLMSESTPKYDALFFASGTSLYYFTG